MTIRCDALIHWCKHPKILWLLFRGLDLSVFKLGGLTAAHLAERSAILVIGYWLFCPLSPITASLLHFFLLSQSFPIFVEFSKYGGHSDYHRCDWLTRAWSRATTSVIAFLVDHCWHCPKCKEIPPKSSVTSTARDCATASFQQAPDQKCGSELHFGSTSILGRNCWPGGI